MSVSPKSLLTMFLSGLDTYEIAKRTGIHESIVSRHIWVARCEQLGKPADFVRNGAIKRVSTKAKAA